MIPYNTKLWGVHPREITSEWCSRFVPLPKLEDVVKGAVGDVPPWRRHLGMVFQHYANFPHMNVARNIAYGLR